MMTLPFFPLLLLVIAFINIIWYQRAAHELPKMLAAGAVIVCLVWGFAIAHWSIHLLGLFFLFKFRSMPSFLRASASRY
ncbi:MAG: hypothetical protein SAJ12_03475 [Jaaginema sp. PMC 1079.18]|nr:hypothetical protein [Jaaginema sp. PMC 1080.18]MEC4850049.1 hypothetical protein [Jaaginema sp. PMC 1079.18]MEC4865149.1 hypothetical protein [Jaaginema sp. PMC 1078.18]